MREANHTSCRGAAGKDTLVENNQDSACPTKGLTQKCRGDAAHRPYGILIQWDDENYMEALTNSVRVASGVLTPS